MKYVVVMPWVDEAYKDACLQSCGFDNVLLIDNSSNNRGVSRSWNMGIDKMFSEDAGWLIVMSAAVRFGEKRGLDFIQHLREARGSTLVVEATGVLFGWHLIAFSRECVHRVGRFDENLFPGPYGDIDYSLRFQRYYNQDFRTAPPPNDRWLHVHIDARDAGMAHALKKKSIADSCDQAGLIAYLQRKWGRHPDHAFEDSYAYPFNDHNNAVGFWPHTIVDDIPGRWDCPAIPDFVDADEIEWKNTTINARHNTACEFVLPWPLCDWDALKNWEHERFASMRDHLNRGDVLYDIGTEQGWCNLLYASYVGPENMVLVEPSAVQWPNIYHTWKRNYDQEPLACFHGFVGSTTNAPPHRSSQPKWPDHAQSKLVTHIAYQHLFDHADQAPTITFDDLVKQIGRPPNAINIDVEGAELAVLQGCAETLTTHRPLVWVSIHPDLMGNWYQTNPQQLHDLMTSHGYTGQFICTDHEDHWLFTP